MINQLFAIFLLIVAWSMAWKGVALWKSARNGSKVWFVALLIVNTFGIFEILYIFVFSRKSISKKADFKKEQKQKRKHEEEDEDEEKEDEEKEGEGEERSEYENREDSTESNLEEK